MGSGTDVNLMPLQRIVITGTKASTTPATPVRLVATNTTCASLCIKAKSTNAGTVKLGGTSATCLFELGKGEAVTIDIDNVYDIYMDVTNSGDGVTFIALN